MQKSFKKKIDLERSIFKKKQIENTPETNDFIFAYKKGGIGKNCFEVSKVFGGNVNKVNFGKKTRNYVVSRSLNFDRGIYRPSQVKNRDGISD